MHAKHITPILNVSDMAQSFAWFRTLGWEKCWDWGDPPTFGAVGSDECEIFICLNGQGHRQDPADAYSRTAGVWLSIWGDDVDAVHTTCLANGIEVTWPPTDESWGVREMHIRHPDGHIFDLAPDLRTPI